MDIKKAVSVQRNFFEGNKTKNLYFRLMALDRLEAAIMDCQEAVCEALQKDLKKSRAEAYMTEVGQVLSELRFIRRRLPLWIRGKRVPTPLAQFHSTSFVMREPYGVVLIMAPWNYPFLLSMEPLIGAIAAGNCVVLKPSAYAPETSRVMCKIIRDAFPPKFVTAVEGGRSENEELLDQKFDYIFFTGSVSVGKHVMEKAAQNLTPVTLELGGKSPCIVDATANLDLAARRIVWGKFLNSGQTCVAPDYILVEEAVKDIFIRLLIKNLHEALGEEPITHPDYTKIINEKHFQRLLSLIEDEDVVEGGYGDHETMQIAPTILTNVSWDAPVMQEEIFGPVLPVLTFRNISEAISRIKNREKPLALYMFSEDKSAWHRVLKEVSFGGGCINDTVIHLCTPHMGFGGVGASGMGSYHGKESYRTFSHSKSVVRKSTWLDLPIRYYPLKKWKEVLLHIFVR